MRVIVPKTIDASTLINSNIPEPDPSVGEVEYVPVDQGGGTIGDSFVLGGNLISGLVIGTSTDNSGNYYVGVYVSNGRYIYIHKFNSEFSYIGRSRLNPVGDGPRDEVKIDVSSDGQTVFVSIAGRWPFDNSIFDCYTLYYTGMTYSNDNRNQSGSSRLGNFIGDPTTAHTQRDRLLGYAFREESSGQPYYETLRYHTWFYTLISGEIRVSTGRTGTPNIASSTIHNNVLGPVNGNIADNGFSPDIKSNKYLIFSRNVSGNTTYIQEYNSSFSSRTKINAVERLSITSEFGLYTGVDYLITNETSTSTISDFTVYRVKPNYQYGEVDPGDPVPAGSVFIKTSSHKRYQAVVDTILDPLEGLLTVPPEWVELGPTNKYAAFDGVISNTASYQNEIVYDFKPSGIYNSISGFNITGATEVNITITSSQGSVVYENTFTMRDNSQVIDWYSYYFSPIIERTQFTVTDLPVYGGSTATLSIMGSDSVSVGEVVVGSQINLGVTQYGVSLQGLDFSQKNRDEFGNFEIIRRGTSKLVDYDVKVDRGLVNYVARQLDQLSTVPCVWVGSDEVNDETTVYGYHKDYLITIDAPSICSLTISVEGLV